MGDEDHDLLLEKYKLLYESTRDIILFVASDGKILDANTAATRAYGYTREELCNMSVFNLRTQESPGLVYSQMNTADTESIVFEAIHRKKNGELMPVEVSSTGVSFGDTRLLMSIVRDISERKKYIDKIEKYAFYDELTGIPNRKSLRTKLCQSLCEKDIRFALILIDIDHFKEVNDTWGHHIGDELLIWTTRKITGAILKRGTLFRLGGDEFVILTEPIQDRNDLCRIATDIQAVLHEPFRRSEISRMVTLSMGISIFPDDGSNDSDLLKKADAAMYKIKETGKNNFGFCT